MCIIATVEAEDSEVHSSNVSVVYVVHLCIVHLCIVCSKALQKRGCMEPMEPSLDLPLELLITACIQ